MKKSGYLFMFFRVTSWTELPFQFFEASCGFDGVFAAIKSRNAEVAFALTTKAAAGCDDDVGFVQELIEGIPTAQISGRFNPNIRRVNAAVNFEARFVGCFAQNFGVAHVMLE